MPKKSGAIILLVILFFMPLPAQAQNSNFVPFISFLAGILNKGVFPTSDNYTTDDDIIVVANDGVELTGNIFVPNNLGGLAPAVIFINSWGFNEYEYLTQAGQLADRGYIVFSYTTRGFGESGGQIGVASPQDVADLSSVIDHIIANYPVDPNAIGSAGVSYGAGISLIASASEPRLKAVGSLSGWADLEEALYGNSSPREPWIETLIDSAVSDGRPDDVLLENWDIIRTQDLSRVDEVRAWASIRSASTYLDQINANNPAIYFAQNYGDNLFQPNAVLDLFSKLTTPKYITLQPGTHATAEFAPVILGIGENYIFEDLYRWFDIHLKGEENALSYAQPVQMKIKFEDYFQSTTAFPVPEAQDDVFYMHPRRWFDIGDLETYPYTGRNYDNSIRGGKGTLFTTALPMLSSTLEQLDIPVKSIIPLSNPSRSIYFKTSKLRNGMQIRGIPKVKVQLQTKSNAAQIVAYLYDMDSLGIGKLITHGVFTLPVATPGEKVTLDIDLVAIAYDVPPGHRIALAFDTKDQLYTHPAGGDHDLDFEYSEDAQSTLTIPRL